MLTTVFCCLFASNELPQRPAWIIQSQSERELVGSRSVINMAKDNTSAKNTVEMFFGTQRINIHEELACFPRDALLHVRDVNNWHNKEHHLVTMIPKPMKHASLVSHLQPITVFFSDVQVVPPRCPGSCVNITYTASLGNNSRTHQAEEIQFTQRIENEPRMQEGLRSVHVGHGRRNGLRHVSYSHIPQKLRFEKISEITVTAWRGFAAPCKKSPLVSRIKIMGWQGRLVQTACGYLLANLKG